MRASPGTGIACIVAIVNAAPDGPNSHRYNVPVIPSPNSVTAVPAMTWSERSNAANTAKRTAIAAPPPAAARNPAATPPAEAPATAPNAPAMTTPSSPTLMTPACSASVSPSPANRSGVAVRTVACRNAPAVVLTSCSRRAHLLLAHVVLTSRWSPHWQRERTGSGAGHHRARATVTVPPPRRE